MMKTDNSGKKQHPNSRANLRPWKPGQSGNPKGRPPNMVCWSAILTQLLQEVPEGERETEAVKLMRALIKAGHKGKVDAIDTVMERTEGKVGQTVQVAVDLEARVKTFKIYGKGGKVETAQDLLRQSTEGDSKE